MIIMSFGMSVIMTAVVTAAGTGIEDGYIERFFKGLVFAFPVAIVAAFIGGGMSIYMRMELMNPGVQEQINS